MKLIFNFQFSIFNYFILLLAIISLNACRSHKKTAVSVPADEMTFYTSCYPIESIFVPSCKLEISDGSRSYSLNSSMYIQKDSVCYFRGKIFVDVIRGAIYRDSFIMVSYLERICYKGKNEYLQKITGYPVNPETLLMLFTADRCEDKINIRDNHQQQQPVFNVEYSDFNQYRQFNLPTNFDISAQDGNKTIRIKANFLQLLFDQQQQVNIDIPSRYEVVVLQ